MKLKARKAIVFALVFVGLSLAFPNIVTKSLQISGKYALEMLVIFPAVLLIMGLADVWVPNKSIQKYLGNKSGLKGIGLSVMLGTLPTGPMYIAFPIAAELIRKGASVTNVIVFLGVWGSLKMPQVGIEIQFLGPKFALWRFGLTLVSVIIIGLIVGQVSEKGANIKCIGK